MWGKAKKIKRIKATDNAADYLAFSEKLDKEQTLRQALDRLTFGPRPGDLERMIPYGLNKWLDAQLHPEKQSGIRRAAGAARALRHFANEHS